MKASVNHSQSIHQIINCYGYTSGGAERLASQLHHGLLLQEVDSHLIGLMCSPGSNQNDKAELQTLSFDYKTPYALGAFFKTFRYIQKEVSKSDIVHAHLSPSIVYCALIKRFSRKNFTLVLTEHNTHNRRRESWFGRIIDQFVYSTADHIICISPGTEEALHSWLGTTKSKTSVVSNGIELSAECYFERATKTELCIVSAGRLTHQKNYENALKAFADVIEKTKTNHKYFIAGAGELEFGLKALAKSLKIESQVIFLGHVSDLPERFKQCDIFLIPSHWEGFGLAAVEAMNAGLPIVASNVSGISELVTGKKCCGLLVDQESPNSIVNALLDLINDEPRRRELGQNGFERSLDFDVRNMISGYLSIYKNLLKDQ